MVNLPFSSRSYFGKTLVIFTLGILSHITTGFTEEEGDMPAETQVKALENYSPGRKNLLDNPGFELGWNGWGPQSYRKDGAPYEKPEIPSAMDDKIKYEGNFSLRVEPNTTIGSRRYPINIGQKYVVSFYARAVAATGPERMVRFFVITPTWHRSDITLEVGKDIGPEWKRYSFEFIQTKAGSAFQNTAYFRIDSNDNTVWIDAVQLEKGSNVTQYDSGLQPGIQTSNPYGLFTHGKPETVTVLLNSTAGLNAPTTVNVVARDIASNIVWKKAFQFPATKDEVSSQSLTLENQVLGVIEVTSSVVGQNGPDAASKWRYCVIEGKPEDARHNPYFGTENGLNWPVWNEENHEIMANFAGSTFSRVFLWQPESGNTPETLQQIKEQLLRKKESGKLVMICVGYPRGAKIHHHVSFDAQPSEQLIQKEISDYKAYASTLATALKGSVDYYQILNEPNLWSATAGKIKGKKIMPPERYMRWLKAAHETIKAIQPDAKLAANVNGLAYDYTEQLFKQGAAKYIDAFTFHSYRTSPENPEPPLYQGIQKLRGIVDTYAKGMPMYNDEQYYGVRDLIANQGEDLKRYYRDSEEEQAGLILQNYLHHIVGNVSFSLFSVHCTLYRYGFSQPTWFYEAYSGYRFMSQLLLNLEQATEIPINPSVRAFMFTRHDGVKIVSVNTKTYGSKQDVHITGADAAFDVNGNKMAIDNVTVSFTPSYFLFNNLSTDAVIQAVQHTEFKGSALTLGSSAELNADDLLIKVDNFSNKPVTAQLTFLQMPNDEPPPSPVTVSIEAHGSKVSKIPIDTTKFNWKGDYLLIYRVSSENQKSIEKSIRLPSIFAAKKTFQVDGDLADWNGVTSMDLTEENLSKDFSQGKIPHKGAVDLSGSVALSWDDQNIYCAIQVNDDVLHPGTGGNDYENNDSVQIFFDMQGDGGDKYDENDVAYKIGLNKQGQPVAFLDKAPSGRYVGANNAEQGIDGDVKVAYRKSPAGYVYEIAFPRAALPNLDFREGTQFGFSVLINDNDGTGRKQGIFLGSKNQDPTGKPSVWKPIKLVK